MTPRKLLFGSQFVLALTEPLSFISDNNVRTCSARREGSRISVTVFATITELAVKANGCIGYSGRRFRGIYNHLCAIVEMRTVVGLCLDKLKMKPIIFLAHRTE